MNEEREGAARGRREREREGGGRETDEERESREIDWKDKLVGMRWDETERWKQMKNRDLKG